MASDRPDDAPLVIRCRLCGTGYTALGFGWLRVVGVQRNPEDPDDVPLDLRRCPVPSCRNTLALPLADAPATIPAPPPNPEEPHG